MATRHRSRIPNPVIQRRAPWPQEKQGTEFNVDDVDGWVDAITSTLHRRDYVGVDRYVEVLGSLEQEEYVGELWERGEIVIYVTESGQFPDLVQPDIEGEAGDFERKAAWIKENASTIIRGEVEDIIGVLRWLAGVATFPGSSRRLGTIAFSRKNTPVFLKDHEYPDGKLLSLNAALLTKAECKVFDEIAGQAEGVKEYNETNQDSVSDFPEDMLPSDAPETVSREQERYVIGPNGHGWAPGFKDEAKRKLQEFRELCEERDEQEAGPGNLGHEHKYTKTLSQKVRHAMRFSKIWCLSDPSDKARPDKDKDFVFMSYETEDMVEDQLGDDLLHDIDELREDEHANLQHISEALDVLDIRWDIEEDYIYVGNVEAHWLFSFDVDDVIEEMLDQFPELGPEDEDEDEDEEDEDE